MGRPRSVGFAVKALTNQFMRRIDKSIYQDGAEPLTGMQHGVIRYVSSVGKDKDVFQKDVENEFNIRRSTATGILQLMEKNGLITREPVAYDARLKKLMLTDRALELHREVVQKIAGLEKRMIAGLTEEELTTFFRVIDKISENMK